MKLVDMTIKNKLICLVMLVCFFIMILASVALFGFINYTFRRSLAQDVLADADMTAENCNFAVAFSNKKDVERLLKSLGAKTSIVFAAVYDADDELFASFLRKGVEESLMQAFPEEQGYYFGTNRLVVYKDIILDNEKIGTLVVCSDLSELHAFVNKVLLACVFVFLLGMGLAFFLSARFQKVISAPILRLNDAAREISQSKDFSVRVSGSNRDEIGSLINSFNKMLERIQQRDTALLEANEKLRDEVTQRMHAEEVLKKSEFRLRLANQELQNFAYITSHDLSEPLRKIVSFGMLLAESLKGKLNDDEKENLEFVIGGADRMQKMIAALLAYSRITAKVRPIVEVDLNKALDKLISSDLLDTIEKKQAKVIVPEPLASVLCDPIQIQQLLQNLISNSMKYQKENVPPEIIIRSEEQNDGMVKILVQDNGIGIKEEYFKNIFVMFRRLHTKEKYDGTGIGLAICKKIVEQYGGNIGVSSTYGQGATFWFTLPSANTRCNSALNISENVNTSS